jgi:phosphoribosylformylglycinamidine synthase PurS subunit
MKRYKIFVTGKEGIFDPAGEQSKTALANLGFTGVQDVSIGKFIEITVDDDITEVQIGTMCDKLLANPVIEDYEIQR